MAATRSGQINELRKREGVFWSRRGRVIAVVAAAAQIDRLRYILAQGPKAGLVASPADWPCACSTPALLGDMKVPEVYTARDARRRNALRHAPRPDADRAQDVAMLGRFCDVARVTFTRPVSPFGRDPV